MGSAPWSSSMVEDSSGSSHRLHKGTGPKKDERRLLHKASVAPPATLRGLGSDALERRLPQEEGASS